MIVSFTEPALYNLTNNLIWPEVINRARSHPEEVTWRDLDGGTALHRSCRSVYSTDVVQEMLRSSKNSVAAIQDKSGKTPLHIACWNGSSEIIRLLVKANKEAAGIPDQRGRIPLHHACSSVSMPCVKTIEILIEANPLGSMTPDKDGETPLSLLCTRHQSLLNAALLCNEGDNVYQTMLKPFWEQLRVLLAANADQRTLHGDWRLLHIVTAVPHCPQILFDLAIRLHPDQVREKVSGSLPLHYATGLSDPFSPSSFGSLTNQHSIDSNEYFIDQLLSLYPDASQIPDDAGCLPVHLALLRGRSYRVIHKLIQAFPDSLLIRDGQMYLTPCFLAALPQGKYVSLNDITQQVETILELLLLDPSRIRPAVSE
jgi:Ankyrin repeats (3 copies)